MVGQDREEANRLQQAKWELTSRVRDESNVPNPFHFSRRSRKRYSAETVPVRNRPFNVELLQALEGRSGNWAASMSVSHRQMFTQA
jgi:hypothetical protein